MSALITIHQRERDMLNSPMCVIFFNFKNFRRFFVYEETVSLTPGLFLFLALLFCRDIRRVEKSWNRTQASIQNF